MRRRIIKSPHLRGKPRNGDTPPRLAIAGTLRWLAIGCANDTIELIGVAMSTAFNTIIDVLDAIIEDRELAVKWHGTGVARGGLARRFRHRSAFRLISHYIEAVDDNLIRTKKPNTEGHLCPGRLFPDHKKVVGLNIGREEQGTQFY